MGKIWRQVRRPPRPTAADDSGNWVYSASSPATAGIHAVRIRLKTIGDRAGLRLSLGALKSGVIDCGNGRLTFLIPRP